ncbi:NAD(P)-dependent oxidoreductase [Adlercreutzia aquisgranensis]|uniref:NAD(P)-dependent oxidoreductase n=1 Tax=Adlercreutzia aquisgranensis TaxID=2941323 RepID=UPI0020418C97|nr:NAD(P)-dependent oxidoreductase [Adlercreutzia aquisgranensis]
MTNVGFIGLGSMGFPMACAVSDAGFRVSFCARSQATKEKGAAAGFELKSTCFQLSTCDLVIVAVRDYAQALSCLEGEEGLLTKGEFAGCVIMTSTITPEEASDLARRCSMHCAGYLSAPVSGGVSGAENRALLSMVSGDERWLRLARPAICAYSLKAVYFGARPENACVVKSIIQMLINANILATSEAYLIAKENGIDPQGLYDSVMLSSAYSKMFEKRFVSLIDNNRDTGMSDVAIHAKDSLISLAVAEKVRMHEFLPMVRICGEVFSVAQKRDAGADAVFALEEYLESLDRYR